CSQSGFGHSTSNKLLKSSELKYILVLTSGNIHVFIMFRVPNNMYEYRGKFMSREHVNHKDIANFAQNKVNLPADKANEYRAQARRLREKVESYLDEHPDFSLKKMMLSGSLAKGTALRTLND